MEAQTFVISKFMVGIAAILWSLVMGLLIIAFGQLILAIREIAHNTRKEEAHGAHYNILLLVAKINNLLGWLVLLLGVAFGIYYLIAGQPIPISFQRAAESVTPM